MEMGMFYGRSRGKAKHWECDEDIQPESVILGILGICGNPVRHGPMLPATRKKVILVKLDVRESWLAMCLVFKNGVG